MTQMISKDYLMDHVLDVECGDGTYQEAVLLEDIYDAPTVEVDDNNIITESPNDAIKTDDEVIDIPMFTESADAYKEWTGEEMGKPSDLISRSDVLDLIRDYFVAKTDELPFHTEDGYEVYDDSAKANDMLIYNKEIRNKVRALPSVSAEPTTRERKEAKSTLLTLKHLFEDEEILKTLDVAIECVSAERVIRCKDCLWIDAECCPISEYKDDNDFCSWAKMKGGTK